MSRLLFAASFAAVLVAADPAHAIPCHTPCSGPAPVCDTTVGFCTACQNDFGGGAKACPASAPACITSGSRTGECGECNASTSARCGSFAPICDVASNTCGCNATSDCQTSTYCDHDVAAAGRCVFGCRVEAGKDHCGAGSICDARDGTIGNCVAGNCAVDTDCGTGRICEAHTCVDGCRGDACMMPPDAGTITDAARDAEDAAPDAGVATVTAKGCSCRTSGERGDHGVAILGLGAVALVLRRRACATRTSPSSIRK